ncbi:hypothetical protein ACCP99_03445 [Xanthomonas sp. NCPPB 3443]|uniref:hypothetical protein n=1 Tax=Xanthomonas TaxID=338 RepID=UPI0035564DF7
MTITSSEVYAQIEASANVLKNLSAKEREQQPYKEFGENYNSLLSLAKEALPNIDPRRWTPAVAIHQSATATAKTNATYAEIHSYLVQLLSILSEDIEPFSGFTTG